MKTSLSTQGTRGMTLLDLLVVLAVIAVLAALILPALARAKAQNLRYQCLNNLKQIGLAYRIWEGDHNNFYPQSISQTNGGTLEFIPGPNAFRHFQIMSNELSTPMILVCPAESDSGRFIGTNFSHLSNCNLSFFVGIISNDANPSLILSGDHNIANGTKEKNGLLELTTNVPAAWTRGMHKKVGDIGLADGSVQMLNISGLQRVILDTGIPTNRLQMPILGP